MILYVKTHKDSTKKLLELINKFSKVREYKINMWISVVFLYTDNELSEEKLRKLSHLQFYQKEYLEINSIKEAKDMYTENCKTQMNKTE